MAALAHDRLRSGSLNVSGCTYDRAVPSEPNFEKRSLRHCMGLNRFSDPTVVARAAMGLMRIRERTTKDRTARWFCFLVDELGSMENRSQVRMLVDELLPSAVANLELQHIFGTKEPAELRRRIIARCLILLSQAPIPGGHYDERVLLDLTDLIEDDEDDTFATHPAGRWTNFPDEM